MAYPAWQTGSDKSKSPGVFLTDFLPGTFQGIPTPAGLNPGALPNGTLGIITTTQPGAGRGAVMNGTPGTTLVAPGTNLGAAVRHGQGQIMMVAPTTTGVQSIGRPPQPGLLCNVFPGLLLVHE